MNGLKHVISAFRQGAPLMLAGVLAAMCGIPSQAKTGAQPTAQSASGTLTDRQSQPAGATSASHKRHGHAAKAVPEAAPVVVTPPDPPPPNWPANAKAELAAVGWDGRALSIQATNSSLQQILRDVSTVTGVKVDGLSSGPNDQRVYGNYGPAPARDVLSSLLQGSGYNVLMVGDQGEGTPRELLLTSKAHGASPAGGQQGNAQANQNPDEDSPEEPETPEQPDPMHRPAGIPPPQPGQNRSPQQMIQELQHRQQQQQDQQQQGTPVPPTSNQ